MDGLNGVNGTNGHGSNGASPLQIDASLGVPRWASDTMTGADLRDHDDSTSTPTRQQLEEELASLKVRQDDARSRLESLDDVLRAVLAEEVAASRQRFAEMDQHFEAMIAAVRDDAVREVDRIHAERSTVVEVGGSDE